MTNEAIANWVLTVTVRVPFGDNTNIRHYLNGFTRNQAVTLAAPILERHGNHIVGVSLSENHTNSKD